MKGLACQIKHNDNLYILERHDTPSLTLMGIFTYFSLRNVIARTYLKMKSPSK